MTTRTMRIISWNIQCCLGVDGKVDPDRIARIIRNMGPADVICLQEVARFNPDLDGGAGLDQPEILAAHFPDHRALFGAAVDRKHSRTRKSWQFGNAILVKPPVIQTFSHQLPQPAQPEAVKHMPRQALEVVIETAGEPLRVMTTHLEFHSMDQRIAQMRRLRDLHAEVAAMRDYRPGVPPDNPYAATPRPVNCILCGDFNTAPGDRDYRTLLRPAGSDDARYHDAWRVINGDAEHPATCGIHDHRQWPEGPHCRDYFFVSGCMINSLRAVEVEGMTDASDHQPLALTLAI